MSTVKSNRPPLLLATNSPVARTPVSYARVMGERVAMNREGLMSATGIGTRAEPVRIRYASMARPESRVVLPARMRDARNSAAYRRPHAHRVAECGHYEFCDGTKRNPCKTLTERRAATCDSCK